MENNLVIEKIFTGFEGEFTPAFIKRTEKRQRDGFCYFMNGEALYLFKNTTYTVNGGDVLYLPEGGDYNILVKENTKHICIDFSFNKKELEPFVIKNVKHLKNDFYKFLYNWLKPSNYKIPKAHEIVNRIYCELLIANNKNYSNSYKLFSKAMEFIVSRYHEQEFTVEMLSNAVGVSPVHLRRVFLNCCGSSPKKTIQNIRFEQAKLLLTNSNLTINEIALKVGFCDQFHFSKSFKEAVGISPTEYKNTSKKNNGV